MILLDPPSSPGKRLVGHSLADVDGNILAVDESVCALLHRIVPEVVGHSYVELTHPEDLALNQIQVAHVREMQTPTTLRKRYLRPEGPAVWCEVQVSFLSGGSDRGRLVGTLYELTSQRAHRTPEQLWRSACRMIASLQIRRLALGEDLFSDLPWSLLLQLYVAEAQGQHLSIAELAASSCSRAVNVSRWLRVLQERGLVEDLEQAICAAQLTGMGLRKIEQLLDETDAV